MEEMVGRGEWYKMEMNFKRQVEQDNADMAKSLVFRPNAAGYITQRGS